MNLLKSLYVSAFTTFLTFAVAAGFYHGFVGGHLMGWMSLIASLPPLAFFIRLFASPIPRTSVESGLVAAISAAGVIATYFAHTDSAASYMRLVALACLLGWGIYILWYSKFAPVTDAPQQGELLPDISLSDTDKKVWTREQLTATPAIFMFYRGNWCPFCVAQIKELAAHYREIAARGVKIFLISPQSQGNSVALANKFDVPMNFMRDEDNSAAKILGIYVKNGLPAGLQVLGYDSDVPRPAVFITHQGGKIAYSDITENYRLRPEPDAFIAVINERLAVVA